jgi:hypothetical protein
VQVRRQRRRQERRRWRRGRYRSRRRCRRYRSLRRWRRGRRWRRWRTRRRHRSAWRRRRHRDARVQRVPRPALPRIGCGIGEPSRGKSARNAVRERRQLACATGFAGAMRLPGATRFAGTAWPVDTPRPVDPRSSIDRRGFVRGGERSPPYQPRTAVDRATHLAGTAAVERSVCRRADCRRPGVALAGTIVAGTIVGGTSLPTAAVAPVAAVRRLMVVGAIAKPNNIRIAVIPPRGVAIRWCGWSCRLARQGRIVHRVPSVHRVAPPPRSGTHSLIGWHRGDRGTMAGRSHE